MQDADLFVEKRAHPRVSVKIPVKYRLVQDHDGLKSIHEVQKTQVQTESLDLSFGGIYIVAEQKLAPGQILNLDFSLPNKPKAISTFAEVVWSKESGAGLHFMMIRNEDLEPLKDFLNEAGNKK